MLESLTYKTYSQLKERKNLLERLVKSHTIWGMTNPPLKSEEEIKAIKNLWRTEGIYIDTIIEKYKDEMIGIALLEEHFEELDKTVIKE